MFLVNMPKKGYFFIHAPKRYWVHFRRAISILIIFAFLLSSALPSYAQSALNLPVPGTMLAPSPAFVPVLFKGMALDLQNPLHFDFIVDSGNTKFTPDQIKEESNRLVKYFLAAMTVPQRDLWVNLSPYEKDRIVPDALGKTELGQDMLAQDYILKQLTASLIYPENEFGKAFWDKIYKKAYEQFGTTSIPVNTFNKVWIVPQEATVFEHGNAVYIVKSRLKVLMEEDYVALQKARSSSLIADSKISEPESKSQEFASAIVREIILPEIEREVNEGAHFALMRQVYHSLILAQWYKETIKESLLSKVYIDQRKIKGLDLNDPTLKDQIYARYVESFKKGVFDLIKVEQDQSIGRMVPRKYFSGGQEFGGIPIKRTEDPNEVTFSSTGDKGKLSVRIEPQRRSTKAGISSKKNSSSAVRKMTFNDILSNLRSELLFSYRSPEGIASVESVSIDMLASILNQHSKSDKEIMALIGLLGESFVPYEVRTEEVHVYQDGAVGTHRWETFVAKSEIETLSGNPRTNIAKEYLSKQLLRKEMLKVEVRHLSDDFWTKFPYKEVLIAELEKLSMSEDISVRQRAIRDIGLIPNDDSQESVGGMIGRWTYEATEFNSTTGELTLLNARRIKHKNGTVEPEFLINGKNDKRDIVLQTRDLNQTEKDFSDGLLDLTDLRVIIRDSEAIHHRILGVAANGLPFVREDVWKEGDLDQIREVIEHERLELTRMEHNEIRKAQVQGGLSDLITQLLAKDKEEWEFPIVKTHVATGITERIAKEAENFTKKLLKNEKIIKKAMKFESAVTGRPEYAVLHGIMGRNRDNNHDDSWSMAKRGRGPRGPPSKILIVAGGGEGTTSFARAVAADAKKDKTYQQVKEEYEGVNTPKAIGAINSGTYDDGGDSAAVRMQIHDSGRWANNVSGLAGDEMSLNVYMTDDNAKIDVLEDGFRMKGLVNINTARKDDLMYIVDEATADRILAMRKRLIASGKEFTKDIDTDEIVELKEEQEKAVNDNSTQTIAIDPKTYRLIKNQFRTEGDHKVSVLEFVKEKILKTQKKIESGEFKQPEDWYFFVNNMIGMAVIVEEYLKKTHDLRLVGTKWQNLVDLAIRIDAGYITPGSTEIDDLKQMGKLYEALGIPYGYTRKVSTDDATMVAILEAAMMKVKGANGEEAAVLFAQEGEKSDGDYLIRKVEVQPSGDVLATRLDSQKEENPINPTIRIKVGASHKINIAGNDVKFLNSGEGGLVVSINEEIARFTEIEEGMTVLKLGAAKKIILPLDVREHKSVIGGVEVAIKSRMVEEQTFITDEILSSRMRSMIFKRAKRGPDGKYVYVQDKKTGRGDKLDKSGSRKVRSFEAFSDDASKPVINEDVRAMIRRVLNAFSYGETGMITSLLPNLLVSGVVDEIYDAIHKRGVKAIFYPKLTEDFETKDLSLKEQIEVLDRSIKKFGASKHGFSDIVTDIILPAPDSDLNQSTLDLFKTSKEDMIAKYNSPKIQAGIKNRTLKISKYYPMGRVRITQEDRDYLAYLKNEKGVRVRFVKNPEAFTTNSKGKVVYNKSELYKKYTEILSEYRSLVKQEIPNSVNVKVSFKRPTDNFVQVANISIPGFDKNDLVSVERSAQRLALEVYNRLTVFGAIKVEVAAEESLFNAFNEIFFDPSKSGLAKGKGYASLGSFSNIVYESDEFSIDRVEEGSLDNIKSSDLNIVRKEDVDKSGTRVGLDIGGSDLKAVVVKDGKIVAYKIVTWSPKEIKDPWAEDGHIPMITGIISDVIAKASELGVDAKDLKSLGVSVNLAVANNRLTGLGPVVEGLKSDDAQVLKGLDDELRKAFDLPVFILNDGDAAAIQNAVDMELENTLSLAGGTGLAMGIGSTQLLTEGGNIVIDISKGAEGHSFSKVPGAAQQYISQRSIFRLAKKEGLDLSAFDTEKEKLKHMQALFEKRVGTPQEQIKAHIVFEEIPQYLADFVQTVSGIVGIKNVVITGRITVGESGEFIRAETQKLLNARKLPIKIHFPAAPENSGVDDQTYLEIGQAVGATYYASYHNDTGSTRISSPGGIDMNNINVNRRGSGVDIQFDSVMMQDILNNGVDGFVPVIINLTPINSVLPMLGLEPMEKESEYSLSKLN
ncbi:MAG: ROK family protein [Candidatus Aceula meridiana]|nr:ROK family protein [Candidatus Aceula meridiana]